MSMNWLRYTLDIKTTMETLSVWDRSGRELGLDEAFFQWKDETSRIRKFSNRAFLIGNGASASMASHVAADLGKNAGVCTETFTDLSLITAIANDISYEEVFAVPLRRRMGSNDMLVAISSSGMSPNILRAVEAACSLGGIVVTLSAMNPKNALRSLGALNFYVPASTYGMAETCHAAILHYWIDLMTKEAEQSIELASDCIEN